MNNFNVNLTITDICCNKCSKCVNEKTLSIFDSATIIPLQDGFSLRIISVTNTRVTIEIRKSFVRIIRFTYINSETNICLPCSECCQEHILRIKINNIVAN